MGQGTEVSLSLRPLSANSPRVPRHSTPAHDAMRIKPEPELQSGVSPSSESERTGARMSSDLSTGEAEGQSLLDSGGSRGGESSPRLLRGFYCYSVASECASVACGAWASLSRTYHLQGVRHRLALIVPSDLPGAVCSVSWTVTGSGA